MRISHFTYLEKDNSRIRAKVRITTGFWFWQNSQSREVEKNPGSTKWYFPDTNTLAPDRVEELYQAYQ